MPDWLEVTLAYASIVIAALTGLVKFMDWAVPRLRDIGARNAGRGEEMVSWLERAAAVLSVFLDVVRRYVPRLAIVSPPERPRMDPPLRDPMPIGVIAADLEEARHSVLPTADETSDDEDDDDPEDPPPSLPTPAAAASAHSPSTAS